MIARLWHGWTRPENADEYQELLLETVLPGIEDRPGYRGAYVLRRVADEGEGEVEFVTITTFDSLADARGFSHDGVRGAVVPPAARELLSRWDGESAHYEVVLEPEEDS